MVKKNLPLLVAISTLIGLLLAQYLHDSDSDGIPNDEDEFPNDPDELEDTDKDGIGDNEDIDDDGDGYNDTIDVFPKNAEEYYDNDLDGIPPEQSTSPEELAKCIITRLNEKFLMGSVSIIDGGYTAQ